MKVIPERMQRRRGGRHTKPIRGAVRRNGATIGEGAGVSWAELSQGQADRTPDSRRVRSGKGRLRGRARGRRRDAHRQLARVAGRVVAVEYDPYWALRLREQFSVGPMSSWCMKMPSRWSFPESLSRSSLERSVSRRHLYCTDLDDRLFPPRVSTWWCKQVALKHARSADHEDPALEPLVRFSTGLELPADVFQPKPQVAACLMVAAKRVRRSCGLHHRHLFLGLVRRAFEGAVTAWAGSSGRPSPNPTPQARER